MGGLGDASQPQTRVRAVVLRHLLQLRPEWSTFITSVFWPETCSCSAQLPAGPGVKTSSQDQGRRTGRTWSVSKHLGENSSPNAGPDALAKISSRFDAWRLHDSGRSP